MAPRVTRGALPPAVVLACGRRGRKRAPRCSSGGSPSRVASVAAAAAVAASSWQPRCEPSSQSPVGHTSSAVVSKVTVAHSSASSGYFSPRDEVSASSLQPSWMCSPKHPGLSTSVASAAGAHADGVDANVIASSDNQPAALSSSLPEEPLSPELQKATALEILFQFDLASEKRLLSAGELDLYDHLLSLLPRLEAEIGKVNATAGIALEDSLICQLHAPSVALGGASSPMVMNEVPSPTVLGDSTSIKIFSDLQFPEGNVKATNVELATLGPEATSSAHKSSAEPEAAVEDDEINDVLYKPGLDTSVAAAAVADADGADAVVIASLCNPPAALPSLLPEEHLSPALLMEIALEVLYQFDLASEKRLLSAGELDLYDHLVSLLPGLEAEIREVNATAPSIAMEDPLICQLHAPSVALGGAPSPMVANEVPSPRILGASTSIKHSAGIELAEGNIVATNADLAMPVPEATPSANSSSAEPEPAVDGDEIPEALYGNSHGCRRLPIFRDVCPQMSVTASSLLKSLVDSFRPSLYILFIDLLPIVLVAVALENHL